MPGATESDWEERDAHAPARRRTAGGDTASAVRIGRRAGVIIFRNFAAYFAS